METNLEAKCDLVRDEISDACLGHDGKTDDFMDHKVNGWLYHLYASAGALCRHVYNIGGNTQLWCL